MRAHFSHARVREETHRLAKSLAGKDGKKTYELYEEAIREIAKKNKKTFEEVSRELRFF